MNYLKIINPDSISEDLAKSYRLRQAVRAVVFDNESNIALLSVKKEKYHKLPGGGIDPGENESTALKRECLEEIGSKIKILEQFGAILEYRPQEKLRQESFCYLAKLTGKKGTPNFTEEEASKDFEPLWLPINEAIKLLESDQPIGWEGHFIRERDLIFLKRAIPSYQNRF